MKTLLAPVLLLITMITSGATVPHGLLVDGKFRIKGMSMEGARVIVERNGVQVQVLQNGIGHFTLYLDLQQDYVLHFIREGCLNKSLHFDTRMPENAMAAAPFRFPFLVTLEPKPIGPVAGYAKAVGVVIFDTARGDFDYSTNYALTREKAIRDKMVDVRRAGPMALSEANGTIEGPARSESNNESKAPSFTYKESQRSVMRSEPGITPDRTAPLSLSGTAVVTSPEEPRKDGRIEEVEVRPTYVARRVRITERGHTREYCKVTHRYGEVHWFCNGASCSEPQYNKLVVK